MTINNNEPQSNHLPFLSGGGEMGELIRSLDWSDNPLGNPGSWPDALKQTVSMMLKNSFPVLICWGPEFIQLYNDAFRPINGESKHPQALGGSARDTYQEIWETIGPMFSEVMQGKTHGFPNFMVPLNRNGYTENCYFDFSYSPIADLDGSIQGVLVICMETTEKLGAIAQAEKAQKETIIERDRLRNFFLQAPAGICVLDGPELTFELINPLYQQLFPGRALSGKPLLEAVPEVKDSAIWEILQGVYQTGKTFEGNELLIPLARTTDGPVEDRYFNFIYQARTDSSGTVDGIMVFVIEVTDMVLVKQKVLESERELEQMLNLLPAHVVVIRGNELVVEMINDSNLAYWDKKKEETIGKPLLVVLPELADQPFPGQLNQVMETGEVISVKESIVTFIEPDGSKRITYVDYSYQPLTDANGQRNRVLVMSFEVTDKVASRKLLEQYANDLQALNEESSAVNEELAATNEELITTQARLEDSFSELASSEARFRYLIQEAPVAIGVLNGRELLIESANDMILRIWGKSNNVLGLPLELALPEIQGQPFLGILDEVYTTGEAFYGSETLAKLEQNGEMQDVYLNFVYQPIADETGATKDILVVAIDVTEQVKARATLQTINERLEYTNQELSASGSRLRMAIESTNLGTWDHNPQTGDLYWSKECREVYGYPEIGPVSFQAFSEHIHPDDRTWVEKAIQIAIDPLGGGHYELTFRIIRFDNSETRWIKVNGRVYFDDGLATRFIGTVLDITDIKTAEEQSAKLAAIIQSSDDAIIGKTLESIITSWNASAERIFGYSAGEMIGNSIYKLIPADRHDEEPRILSRLKSGDRVQHFETKRQTMDGRLIDVSMTISPVKNPEGDIIGLSTIARDITEKKLDEARKNDFIGMVSHELKTPLTSLNAILQVASLKLKNSEDNFLSGAMQKANQQAKRMTAMINGFLNISRLESGKIHMEKEEFDMEVLISEMAEEVGLTADSHAIRFDPCNPVMVSADRDKIGSVISNFISNAVKYSPKGKQIEVSCTTAERQVIVSVKDEGMGIKPEDLEKIFDRYYRVETKHTRHIAGFGIGLYLSAEIIERHGGKVWAESQIGTGSTFYFSLPLGALP